MNTIIPACLPQERRAGRKTGYGRAGGFSPRRDFLVCLVAWALLSGPASGFLPVSSACAEEVPPAGARENPHFRFNRCDACHPGGKPPRLLRASTDALCLDCHSEERNRIEVHPTRIASHKGEVRKVPSDFPLIQKRLACITCHDPLIQCSRDASQGVADPLFLRGGPYKNPWDICFRCHEKKLYEIFNPHDQIDDRGVLRKETCLYCHEPAPPDQDQQIVGDPKDPNCVSCHRIVLHPAGKDHLRTPSRKVAKNLQRVSRQHDLFFPLSPEGEIYCGTCHNPHEKGVLKPETPAARGAEGDRPEDHRVRAVPEEICFVCHGFRPYTGTSSHQGR